MASLGPNRYGKQKVRLLKRFTSGKEQSLIELSVDALLEGTFDESYLGDDNSQIVATDTVKNTIIALSHNHLDRCIEEFGLALGRHFLSRHAQVDRVYLELREKPWTRLQIDGKPLPHTFRPSADGIPYTSIVLSQVGAEITSGIRDFLILNSTNSAFVGFDHTEFTTLRDATDRILCTQLHASWRFIEEQNDFRDANSRILHAMQKVFATAFSPSVQRTLFEMGEAALHAAPEISEIELRMPNKHYLAADLSPFGIANDSVVFLPQDEPHGEIEATIRR